MNEPKSDKTAEEPALADKSCTPCRGGAPRLPKAEIGRLIPALPGWEVAEQIKLRRTVKFKNFQAALSFVNSIAAIAEAEQHHPDIAFGWGYCRIEIWTHAIGGLSENDFTLAAKIDRLIQDSAE